MTWRDYDGDAFRLSRLATGQERESTRITHGSRKKAPVATKEERDHEEERVDRILELKALR
jgi:hypothetical protein